MVDQNAHVVVYDMHTQERLFEDTNANSVAWNSVLEGQLCYSGKDQLYVYLPPILIKLEAHTKLEVMHKSRNDDNVHTHTYVGTHARIYACTHRHVGTHTHM